MTSRRLVKSAEAASYCGLSVAAFRAWIKREHLRIKVRGANLYDLQALDFALNKMNGIAEIPKAENDNLAFERNMRKVNRNATIPRRRA